MKRRPRIYYSTEQKNLMWDRWQAGDSLHEIARLFDRGTHRFNVCFLRLVAYDRERAVAHDLH